MKTSKKFLRAIIAVTMVAVMMLSSTVAFAAVEEDAGALLLTGTTYVDIPALKSGAVKISMDVKFDSADEDAAKFDVALFYDADTTDAAEGTRLFQVDATNSINDQAYKNVDVVYYPSFGYGAVYVDGVFVKSHSLSNTTNIPNRFRIIVEDKGTYIKNLKISDYMRNVEYSETTMVVAENDFTDLADHIDASVGTIQGVNGVHGSIKESSGHSSLKNVIVADTTTEDKTDTVLKFGVRGDTNKSQVGMQILTDTGVNGTIPKHYAYMVTSVEIYVPTPTNDCGENNGFTYNIYNGGTHHPIVYFDITRTGLDVYNYNKTAKLFTLDFDTWYNMDIKADFAANMIAVEVLDDNGNAVAGKASYLNVIPNKIAGYAGRLYFYGDDATWNYPSIYLRKWNTKIYGVYSTSTSEVVESYTDPDDAFTSLIYADAITFSIGDVNGGNLAAGAEVDTVAINTGADVWADGTTLAVALYKGDSLETVRFNSLTGNVTSVVELQNSLTLPADLTDCELKVFMWDITDFSPLAVVKTIDLDAQ